MPGKIISQLSVVLGALIVAANANADTKKYLVKFKDSAQYFATYQGMSVFKNPLEENGAAVQGSERKLLGTNASVTQALNNIKMMVVESANVEDIQKLKNDPAIALVEEEIMHPAPKLDGNVKIERRRREDDDQDQGSQATIIPMPWGIKAVHAPQAWSVTRGQGARVLVLDTGVDKSHPALAGQIETTQNFTSGDPNDVTDDVGHGTHVSGTILANGANGGLVGVAPEAKLLMGKVCTPEGCSSVAVASGLNWAVDQHVDVVSMSLGGTMISDGEALAVEAAESNGVTVIAASGNESKMAVSYPGAMPTVLAVGAVDINLKKAGFSNWGPELGISGPGVNVFSSVPLGTGRKAVVKVDGQEVLSTPFQGSPAAELASGSLVFANLGKPEDFTGLDLSGKFALIQRGEIPFKDKVANAVQAGAVGVIIYNNAAGMVSGAVAAEGQRATVPVIAIDPTVGEQLKDQISGGLNVTITMGIVKTDFASFQGTSMATPHVSGVAALVKAANRALTPAQVREILKGTATPLSPNDENQLGAGMVNAEAAVNRAASSGMAMVRAAM